MQNERRSRIEREPDAPDISRPAPAYLINSVDHALRLLLLMKDRPEVRVRDVAQELGVAHSTAHRLLSTLQWRGFVAQDRGSKTYRTGRVLVEVALSSIRELDVRRKARSHMEQLSARIHETVNLIVLEEEGCRFIDGVEGDQMVRVSSRTGTLLPAYATSGGKVLLAELDPQRVRDLYPRPLRPLTERTVPTLDRLLKELDVIRGRGYGVNMEESADGLHAVAVPIRDHNGRAIAALAVSAPAARLTPTHVPLLVEALRESAAAISAELS